MSVYFIQPEGEQVVKIGIAGDVRARLSALQMSHHRVLSVIGTMPGGGVEEHALHRRFASCRLRGEWFRLSPELAEFVSMLSKASAWQAAALAADELVVAIRADLLKRELSVKDVAKRHGIGTSTIYYLFKGGRHKVQNGKAAKSMK